MSSPQPGLIGFDATPLEVVRPSGISRYTAHLLDALVARPGRWRYALLASRTLAGLLGAGTLDRTGGPVGPGFPVRSVWMQLVLPRILERLRPELCHFTNYIAPLAVTCPYVLTLHDMTLFKHPTAQPRRTLVLVRAIMPRAARRAAAIITSSKSGRADAIATLGLAPDRVHVVYGAAGPAFQPMRGAGDAADARRVRQKYGLDEPFLFFVGTIEPRKNLERLVSAFLAARRRGRPEHLVIAGQLGWKYRRLLDQIGPWRAGAPVRLLGYVPDEDLPALYRLARAVAFPSLYEGFGLPIVEAMACGTPVITSNRSSMAEIASGAAVLVDPTDSEALSEAIVRVLQDEALREALRAAGLARAAQFSWARAASETAAIYDAACATCAAPLRPPPDLSSPRGPAGGPLPSPD